MSYFLFPFTFILMTDLLPQAQAVLDAFENASDGEYIEGVWVVNERTMLAAALCAAADQVVPKDYDHWDGRYSEYWSGYESGQNDRNDAVRRQFLAIAAELEGN